MINWEFVQWGAITGLLLSQGQIYYKVTKRIYALEKRIEQESRIRKYTGDGASGASAEASSSRGFKHRSES